LFPGFCLLVFYYFKQCCNKHSCTSSLCLFFLLDPHWERTTWMILDTHVSCSPSPHLGYTWGSSSSSAISGHMGHLAPSLLCPRAIEQAPPLLDLAPFHLFQPFTSICQMQIEHLLCAGLWPLGDAGSKRKSFPPGS
jgi:hypothetical protein